MAIPSLPTPVYLRSGPVRVAQVIQSVRATSGGTSTAFLQTFAALIARPDASPHAYTQVLPANDPGLAFVAQHPERWTTAPDAGELFLGSVGRAVVNDIRTGAFDLVHVHGLWSRDLAAAALAAQRRGVPVVWSPHGMLVQRAYRMKRLKKELFMRLRLARALRGASAMVFASQVERDTSVRPAGAQRVRREIIPLPVELPADLPPVEQLRAEGRARHGIPPGAPVIVFMGRLHEVKRLDLAIHALVEARRERPDLRLLLVGSGDGGAQETSLRDLPRRLGVADAVIFAGWADGLDKWRALAAGDALTLQSMFENFGYVAIEAAALGLPVIMTENLSLAADAVAAGAGFSCEATPEDLAAGWIRALSVADPEQAAHASREWVRHGFSPAAVGDRLLRLYRSLLSSGPSVR